MILGRNLDVPVGRHRPIVKVTRTAQLTEHNHRLRRQTAYAASYQTRKYAERDIAAYIELFYSCQYLHSGLDYATPLEVYREKQANLTLTA